MPIKEGAVARASGAGEDGRHDGHLFQVRCQRVHFVVFDVFRVPDDGQRQIYDGAPIWRPLNAVFDRGLEDLIGMG